MKSVSRVIEFSDAAYGSAGWVLVSSDNPITTRGADYAHHNTASPLDLKTQRHLWSFYFGGLKLVEFLAKTESTKNGHY